MRNGGTHPELDRPADDSEARERGWFLKDSAWDDSIWILAPTNALEQERPVRLHWDFSLPSGRCFTDRSFAPLLKVCRALIARIRCDSLNGLSHRATTVAGYSLYLRQLLRWMETEGYSRFADLDSKALHRFQRTIADRTTHSGARVSPSTVQKYLDLLVYMYRFRAPVGDELVVDPCPGQSTGARAGVHESNRQRWPYTPDPIVVPLVEGAIGFLSYCAVDLLRARELYAITVADAQRRYFSREVWRKRAIRVLRQFMLNTPRGPCALGTPADLARLLNVLYAACFITISYLVGARASEILQLRVGCVQPLEPQGDADESLSMIVGALFKRETAYYGRPHQWVAPTPAIHAITVLEALSAPHRDRTGRQELWLRPYGHVSGAHEWHKSSTSALRVMDAMQMRLLLRRASGWFQLPPHQGKPWRLATHQGRKTFVRFAALRDRSALFALAQHLGHRERGTTDRCYAGSDYVLNQEIDSAIFEESVSAWEHMLSAPRLGGRGGAQIVALRPRFRGARIKQDLAQYARELVGSGLTLGVCEWGFCVYRQQYSACRGSTTAPNPVGREPSTCARCQNFVLSSHHRPYWQEQARRHEALLNNPALPAQTLKIARERLGEARSILRSIDDTRREVSHA